MFEAQPEPISRPNSALDAPPGFAQLHLVNVSLEKNSRPRHDYSRQFSVTPERQTPESQRTPRITWPDPDPIEQLKEAKGYAAKQAKLLERFHDGRELLRKEEPERYGVFGEDLIYWESQTWHWRTENKKLEEEYERRKLLEIEGRAADGYAESLLLSPVPSSSPPPSDGILRATATEIKKYKSAVTKPLQPPATKKSSQRRKKRSLQLSQLTPKDSLNSISEASRRWKHTGTAEIRDIKERNQQAFLVRESALSCEHFSSKSTTRRSPLRSMSNSDYEPVSQPNSAIDGFTSFRQLEHVNRVLEKSPHPREDFHRQFSVTPERQTPESQRTPYWPTPDPEEYREATDSAEEAKDSLKRFYAGRVLLREAPDGSMVCGRDPAYWRSKAEEWLDEVQRLQNQYETRTSLEERGEAENGYAQALLSSPLQSPSSSLSDDSLRAATMKTKRPKTVLVRRSTQPMGTSQSRPSKKDSHPQEPTPDLSSDTITQVTKDRKRSRAVSRTREEDIGSLDQMHLEKRRRDVTYPTSTHRSDAVARTARERQRMNQNISKADTNRASKRKNLSPGASQALRVLPWDLRLRSTVSYREVGTKAASERGTL